MLLRLVSFAGFLTLTLVAWILSSNRKRVSWKTVGWGLGLQLAIGLLVFQLPGSQRIFVWANDVVLALIDASRAGTTFLLGPLAATPGEPGSVGFILIFQVLPVAIFFSALTAALYHLRILPLIVRAFARIFKRVLGISGAESLCGAANIFVGVESALVIRPYLDRMTRSELLTVLATGMATVASSTLGIYVSFLSEIFPQIAGHLLSASVLAIPAAVVMTKLLVPEVEQPETFAHVPKEDPSLRSRNLMGAIIQGAMDGVKLAVGISALIIAMLGIVALIDKGLGGISNLLGLSQQLSIVRIMSWVFYPFAFLLGLSPSDVPVAARLLGERVLLTEVVSYQDLAQLMSSGQIHDPRSVVIMSYALCGFAHIASVAIFVGGTAALAPSRRDDLAALGSRAFLAATLATLMTGCVAGIFAGDQGLILTGAPQ